VDKTNIVVINILDREYRINCPISEQDTLALAAEKLDFRMREIKKTNRHSGKLLASERLAVMAALNATHQLMDAESQLNKYKHTVSTINKKLDDTLNKDSQMEL
jgi:cell division protein ZapA